VVTAVQTITHACQTYDLIDDSGASSLKVAGDYAITPPAGISQAYGFYELSTVVTPDKYKGHLAVPPFVAAVPAS
jgi:hypothetical protein